MATILSFQTAQANSGKPPVPDDLEPVATRGVEWDRLRHLATRIQPVARKLTNLNAQMNRFVSRFLPQLDVEGREALLEMAQAAAQTAADGELMERVAAPDVRPMRDAVRMDVNARLLSLRSEIGQMLPLGTALRLRIAPHTSLRVQAGPEEFDAAICALAQNGRDALQTRGWRGGVLTVRTRPIRYLDKRGTWRRFVQITIADDGAGMTPDVRRRAGEPFFTTKAGNGTGLGLYWVRAFVRAYGGHLRLHSDPARGTIVQLMLPFAQDALPDGYLA